MSNSDASPKAIELSYSEVWAAFDAMPKIMREAVSRAAFEYDTIAILADYNARKNDIFNSVTPYEYTQVMESNFRRDAMEHSVTKAEKNGQYILTRRRLHKVHVGYEPERTDVHREAPTQRR